RGVDRHSRLRVLRPSPLLQRPSTAVEHTLIELEHYGVCEALAAHRVGAGYLGYDHPHGVLRRRRRVDDALLFLVGHRLRPWRVELHGAVVGEDVDALVRVELDDPPGLLADRAEAHAALARGLPDRAARLDELALVGLPDAGARFGVAGGHVGAGAGKGDESDGQCRSRG